MSKKEAELINSFRRLLRNNNNVVPAKVIAVNENNTIKVEADNVIYDDVRLKSIVDDEENCVLIVPQENSDVLINFIAHSDFDAFVSMYSVIRSIYVKIGDTKFFIEKNNAELLCKQITAGDKDKAECGVKGDTLNALLRDLITSLSSIANALNTFASVQTGVTSASPLNVLQPAYSTLTSMITQEISKINSYSGKLKKHLTKNVKLS